MHNLSSSLSVGRKIVTYLRFPFAVASTMMALFVISGCGVQQSTRVAWVGASMDYHEPYFILPVEPPVTYTDQTLRQIVDVAGGGKKLRLRISNLYGISPLLLDSVHVAKSTGNGSIDGSTDTELKFNGQASVTIPVGQVIWSDMTPYNLTAQSDLAISMHVPNLSSVSTIHASAMHTNYVTNGNTVSHPLLSNAQTNSNYAWISGVDVSTDNGGPVIVSIGASVSEGAGSTINADRRYTDLLQQRIATSSDFAGGTVVNAGLSGNRLLHDGIGINLLTRFEGDALGQSGVSHVIVLVGSNDIGYGETYLPSQAITPAQFEGGLMQLVTMAHAKRVKVILGTIPPFNGNSMYTSAGEMIRTTINDWIRSNAAVSADGFIDFDAILRDPADNTKLLASYDSGDHLHPNDAGNAAMANNIDLSLFRK